MWAREPKAGNGKRPGLRESLRWTEGYERIAETASAMLDTRLVYVADREADILELMQCTHALGTPADWLIRSQHDHSLPEGRKLWAQACSGDALGEIEFTLPARPGQAERTVRQHLWAQRITLADGRGGPSPSPASSPRKWRRRQGLSPSSGDCSPTARPGRTHLFSICIEVAQKLSNLLSSDHRDRSDSTKRRQKMCGASMWGALGAQNLCSLGSSTAPLRYFLLNDK